MSGHLTINGVISRPAIPYLLAYAHTVAARFAGAELAPYGLTLRQYGLLTQLAAEPELTISELARQLGVTRQSLHGMVEELERAGHLSRMPGASGRTRRLMLTPRALRLLARAAGALHRAEVGLAGGLSRAEVETLRGLLQRLLADVTDDESWLAGMPQR
jgi:DNA-binding MarR family transcriptional regulator